MFSCTYKNTDKYPLNRSKTKVKSNQIQQNALKDIRLNPLQLIIESMEDKFDK